jgi:hypothetical protein
MAEVKDLPKIKSNIVVDVSLDTKYRDIILFPEKYQSAMEHFKNRDIKNEIAAALKREKITKP